MTSTTPAAPPAPSNGSTRWTSVLLIVVGAVLGVGLLLIGTVAAAGAVISAANPPEHFSVTADGDVDAVEIEVGSEALSVEFGDVDEPTLQWRGQTGDDDWWQLHLDGGVLRVTSNVSGVWNVFANERGTGTLILPLAVQSDAVPLTATVNSGAIDVEGTFGDAIVSVQGGFLGLSGAFGDVDVQVASGFASIDGTTGSLDVAVTSGAASIEATPSGDVAFGVSSGSIDAAIDGPAPSEISVSVDSGSLSATVPDVAYDVAQDVQSGNASVDVERDSGSPHTLTVQVSSGSVDIDAD